MTAPLPSQRHHFDIPDDVAWLNAAYMGPLSHETLAAATAGLSRKARPWELKAPDAFYDEVEELRTEVARLVGGDAEGVAIMPSASYGVATAAANVTVGAGQTIVVLAEQFPSNVYAWTELAERRGAEVRVVARPTDGAWTPAVAAAIDDRTAVVACPHCHWTDGGLVDLVEIGARARAHGAALIVDASQSLGILPFDVAAIRPAMVVSATYKWMLGPYSLAVAWFDPAWRSGEALERSWMTRANRRDFAGLVDYTDRWAPGARRYDVGETSNFPLVAAALCAVRQSLDWGIDAIAATARRHTDRIADAVTDLGFTVAPRELRAGHLLGVRLGGPDPGAVAALLADRRVHVSVRGDSIRVAPHVYTTDADTDRLLEALGAVAPG